MGAGADVSAQYAASLHALPNLFSMFRTPDPGRCLRVPSGHRAARMRNLAIMTSCTMTPQRPIGGARRRLPSFRRVVAVFEGTAKAKGDGRRRRLGIASARGRVRRERGDRHAEES